MVVWPHTVSFFESEINIERYSLRETNRSLFNTRDTSVKISHLNQFLASSHLSQATVMLVLLANLWPLSLHTYHS